MEMVLKMTRLWEMEHWLVQGRLKNFGNFVDQFKHDNSDP